ncbi:MAG: hypothetical protein SCM11_16735 [Bacillota bacterium]|nr:hypothetical protein [Bacillota bacterium]
MATWNERINDMLSRLEAAAAGNEPSRPAMARPMPQQKSYQGQQGFTAPESDDSGPGTFARNLDLQEEKAEKKSAAQPAAIVPVMNANTLIQGVVFAEILGKPLARRRGRGRYGI